MRPPTAPDHRLFRKTTVRPGHGVAIDQHEVLRTVKRHAGLRERFPGHDDIAPRFIYRDGKRAVDFRAVARSCP